MHDAGIHYFPLTGPFLLVLLLLVALWFVLAVLRVLKYAYARIGIAPQYFFAVMVLTLVGSYVNLPILVITDPRGAALGGVSDTIVALNVGGGVIPIVLSVYLTIRNRIYKKAVIGTLIVAAVCYVLAEPVPGEGIAISVFYPPIITAVTALLLSRTHAAPMAYICGSLGTLIGADVLNLGLVSGLGAPVVSIGGAGKFDAIFITGLLAGLLASVGMRRTSH
jgi:uncharacterized membrane protein